MSVAQNHLIESLPEVDRADLLAWCEPVELTLGAVLCERGQWLRHAHFPLPAFVSMLAQAEGHPDLEVTMIGRDGMLGAHLALGVMRVPLRDWRAGC